MHLSDTVTVVTGAGSGIGRALCRQLTAERVRFLGVVDVDLAKALEVAREFGGVAFQADVSDEAQVRDTIQSVIDLAGPIDLYCSNAGVLSFDPDPASAASATPDDWAQAWGVNVMAHVHAARALLPMMCARRQGHFLITASAAGLLSAIGSASYATTKHAAVGFAEALAITHRNDGVRVSLLCPQAVATDMLTRDSAGVAAVDGVLSADDVARCAIDAVEREAFLVLPHPKVAQYMERKVKDYDRWIVGMAQLRSSILSKK